MKVGKFNRLKKVTKRAFATRTSTAISTAAITTAVIAGPEALRTLRYKVRQFTEKL